MSPRHFRSVSSLISSGLLALAPLAVGETVTGVVSDSLNGMLLDSVTVSAAGASTLTDAKGAFTLEISASGIRANLGSGKSGIGEGSEASPIYSLRGERLAHAVPSVFTYSALSESGPAAFGLAFPRGQSLAKPAAFSQHFVLSLTRNNYDPATVTVSVAGALSLKMKSPYPLRNVLRLFTAPGIPETGPQESPVSLRGWATPATLPQRVGKGPAQHDLLYVGENYRRICLMIGGKLVWKYDSKDSWELDDIWMLSNGNILYSHMTYIEEITPAKQVVWHYDNPTGSEIHSCQPIGLDKVLIMQNQQPASRLRLYNKTTKVFEIDQEIPSLAGGTHTQCRRVRMTARGTYIVSSLGNRSVAELDKDFKVLWTYKSTGSVWSAAALKNGNVLIQDESASASVEVDKTGQVVWKWAKSEIALPAGTQMGNTQTCERLSNGNTVMFGNGGKNPANIQAVEATPGKEVVWMLQDWIDLGDATSGQFLDEPGYPEIPGQTNH